MHDRYDRREFLEAAALGGLGLALPLRPGDARARSVEPASGVLAGPPLETVRTGFVGLGHQGSSHVETFLRLEGVEIRAMCDIVPEKVERMQRLVLAAGRPRPAGYSRGPEDFRRMCEEEDLDLVFNATPWEWHAPVCAAAMRNGKHAATEVPLAVRIEECWELVELAEATGRHCVMMENVCYDRTELMILNMVRQGVFGELVHAECGYLHDLRELKLGDYYEGRWRIKHSIRRNGDLYPTHGIGPVAQWMNVNRGNRFDYLVSMSSKSRGLNVWAAEHLGADSPEARQAYALGDVVNSLIRTAFGETVLVTHDTSSPRPYSRRALLQGTGGIVRKYPEQKIHLEGRSAPHQWEDLLAYRAEYEHPLWRALEERSRGAGHGGMDYIEDFRLIQCLREGAATDMDVYDGAAWTAIAELSERSIAARGRSVDFPDFTGGGWKDRPPLAIVDAGALAERPDLR